jgi:polyhydroxyalkanoate synthesis regulator phasin
MKSPPISQADLDNDLNRLEALVAQHGAVDELHTRIAQLENEVAALRHLNTLATEALEKYTALYGPLPH